MQGVTESGVEIEQFADGITLRVRDGENQRCYTPGGDLPLGVNIRSLLDQLLDAVYMTVL
jgi:hypothetical protein